MTTQSPTRIHRRPGSASLVVGVTAVVTAPWIWVLHQVTALARG